jgi:hypothetical protein
VLIQIFVDQRGKIIDTKTTTTKRDKLCRFVLKERGEEGKGECEISLLDPIQNVPYLLVER